MTPRALRDMIKKIKGTWQLGILPGRGRHVVDYTRGRRCYGGRLSNYPIATQCFQCTDSFSCCLYALFHRLASDATDPGLFSLRNPQCSPAVRRGL
ncbi:hypothetical protein AVEN_196299-1 [Araneus ventricosus]|uniref:Uncharacterized protein n=1 Tax=Araneus ventricosus TaxID=182803 RepID=A0A4Y2LM10_ARAVE|nr:hypothetical protein AVEN_196299-1 [Araneus ventricosus]